MSTYFVLLSHSFQWTRRQTSFLRPLRFLLFPGVACSDLSDLFLTETEPFPPPQRAPKTSPQLSLEYFVDCFVLPFFMWKVDPSVFELSVYVTPFHKGPICGNSREWFHTAFPLLSFVSTGISFMSGCFFVNKRDRFILPTQF